MSKKKTILIIVFALLGVTAVYRYSGLFGSSSVEYQPYYEPPEILNYEPIPFPENGTVIVNSDSECESWFTVITPDSGYNHLIVLKSINNNDNITMYIESDSMVTAKIPYGRYEMYQSYGKEWYGDEIMFNSLYFKAKDTLRFSQYAGLTVSLQKVKDGNLPLQQVSKSSMGGG
jgi:hypothetical protein